MAAAPRTYNNLGPRIALAGGFQLKLGSRVGGGLNIGSGFPKSGTAGTTVKNGRGAPNGALYLDDDTNVYFVNDGTATSPYWMPVSFDQRGLLGWYSDFKDGQSVAVTATNTSDTLSGSGLRIHGAGTDSNLGGMVVNFDATDGKGAVADLSTDDVDAAVECISVGTGTTPVFQPDQNGTMVIDVSVTPKTALTNKAMFVGFSGLGTALLPPLMTYATTTITNVAVDIAGMTWSSELTLNDDWISVNFDDNAGATRLAASFDTGADAVVGTYQRLRVEIDADGVMRNFVDKTLVYTSAAAAVDVDEELNPHLYVESSTTAVQACLVRHYATWGKRA